MKHLSHSVLAVELFLLLAVGVYGQTQRPSGVRSVDASPTVSSTVEPDSPGSNATVTAGPQAVIPRLMIFSGVLHDAAGKPLSGAVDVTFSLYSTEAGGNPLWFETQSVQADELGRYTALLGAMHADGLPIDLFTSGEVRWLGIQVGLEAEQQPRVLLVSVPYALKAGDAETLGGKPASAYMLSDSENGTASTTSSSAATNNTAQTGSSGKTQKGRTASKAALTPCTSVTSDGTALLNSIALFSSGPCNIESSVISQASGLVGIGTTNPGAQLDVRNSSARNSIAIRATNANGTMMLIPNLGAGGYNNLAQVGDQGLIFYGPSGNAGNLVIGPWSGTGTPGIRMTTAGNVGIGTSTPAAKLEVNGTAQFDGVVTFAAAQSFPHVGVFNTTTLFNNFPSVTPAYIRIDGTSSATASEALRASVMPTACKAGNLTVALSSSAASLMVILRVNGVSTALGCTISGGTGCTDAVHSVAIAPSNLLDIQLAGGSTGNVVYTAFTCG